MKKNSKDMKQETVTISKKEYEKRKKKAAMAEEDALTQIRESLEDLKHGRVHEL